LPFRRPFNIIFVLYHTLSGNPTDIILSVAAMR
jgi:hypothetical protein